MPRPLRTVEPGLPHHVTQRGVDRQAVFFTAADRAAYLSLVAENQADARVSLIAYCLMTNHVHWIVTPEREDSLAVLFRRVHGRYAQYLNARRGRTGHLWQNRYFCCPLERVHLWTAVRYVELNPVRAGLVEDAAGYRWSSASAHWNGPDHRPAAVELDWTIWREGGGADGWRAMVGGRESLTEVVQLRRCTYSGKPFGSMGFVEQMEVKYGRQWKNRGRPRKPPKSEKGSEQTASFLSLRKGVSSG
jgi:putative transposase